MKTCSLDSLDFILLNLNIYCCKKGINKYAGDSKERGPHLSECTDFPGAASGKEPACQCRRHEMWVQSLGQEDPLEEGMATHSSILAWRISWIEQPGGLQSRVSQRVRHD